MQTDNTDINPQNKIMSKTVEELMRPRYKVIADYPDSKFKVGEILEQDMPIDYPGWFSTNRRSNNDGRFEEILKKFPHIFQKIEWWEERNKEEMPEYVRVAPNWPYRTGEVYKVESVERRGAENLLKIETDVNPLDPMYFIPATQSEYQSFIQKSNQ